MNIKPTPLPFSNARIRELYIKRFSDPTATTPEAHDCCDMFQLRAKMSDGTDEFITEATGKQNLWALEDAKQSFLNGES